MTAPSPTVVEVLAAHRAYGDDDCGIEECGCKATPPEDAWEEDFGDLLWHEAHVAQALADAGVLGPEQAAGLRAERDALRAKIERVEALADEWKRTTYTLPPGYPMSVNRFCEQWFKQPLRQALGGELDPADLCKRCWPERAK